MNTALLLVPLSLCCSMAVVYLFERFSRMAHMENQLEVFVFEEKMGMDACYRILDAFYSFLPSRCTSCKKIHRPWDYLSALVFLRPCSSMLLWVSVISELSCLFLLSAIYFKMGNSAAFFFLVPVLVMFLVIAAVDYRYYIIPDELNLAGALLGLGAAAWVSISGNTELLHPLNSLGFMESLEGMILSSGILYALGTLASQVLNRDAMGGGDMKLCAFLGACFGLNSTLMALALASVLGSFFGVLAMIRSRFIEKNTGFTMIAFGPYIIIAMFLLLIFDSEFLLKEYQDFSMNLIKTYLHP